MISGWEVGYSVELELLKRRFEIGIECARAAIAVTEACIVRYRTGGSVLPSGYCLQLGFCAGDLLDELGIGEFRHRVSVSVFKLP